MTSVSNCKERASVWRNSILYLFRFNSYLVIYDIICSKAKHLKVMSK